MSMQEILQLHSMYAHNEKVGVKETTVKQDKLPRKISFKAMKDDGVSRLHTARWLRLSFLTRAPITTRSQSSMQEVL